MDDLMALGRRVLASQPFSVLLGAELLEFTARTAVLRIPLRGELLQQNGFAHGGVLSYLADNALTFAGGGALGVNVVTAEFKINYLRPALGNSIVARASVIHTGRNQAVCRCEIFVSAQGGEELCAVAQGTIARLEAQDKR